MMLGWLLFPLLLIGAMAAFLGWRPQSGRQSQDEIRPSSEEILKQRYARGEINPRLVPAIIRPARRVERRYRKTRY